jgi:hypothetical protein
MRTDPRGNRHCGGVTIPIAQINSELSFRSLSFLLPLCEMSHCPQTVVTAVVEAVLQCAMCIKSSTAQDDSGSEYARGRDVCSTGGIRGRRSNATLVSRNTTAKWTLPLMASRKLRYNVRGRVILRECEAIHRIFYDMTKIFFKI